MVISCLPWEIVMLENYYVRPVTIDRIRGSWIAPAIEQYVGWLAPQRVTSRSVLHRGPLLLRFGGAAQEGWPGAAQSHAPDAAPGDSGLHRSRSPAQAQ